MRPAIRLAALAELRSIFVFTHDSIGLGEDGPSHEPIEQLAALRAIPESAGHPSVRRQRDALGVAGGDRAARPADRARAHAPARADARSRASMRRPSCSGAAPTCSIVRGRAARSRRHPDRERLRGRARSSRREPILRKAGVRARLVSMPSWRLFEEQTAEYRESVLPAAVTARLAVEAASPLGWERWTGLDGAIIGIDRFGASAPGDDRAQGVWLHRRARRRPGARTRGSKSEAVNRGGATWTSRSFRNTVSRSGSTTSGATSFRVASSRGWCRTTGIRGITTNPSIFEQAIAGTHALRRRARADVRRQDEPPGASTSTW